MKSIKILKVRKLSITILFILSGSLIINAQSKRKKDLRAIKSMSGCYEVEFNFAETFEYSNDSTYIASKTKHDRALEWVQLVEDNNDKVVLQHLLIVGNPNKPHIIKHWRQDWVYQNTDFYMYDVDNQWKYVTIPKNEVKGQWTQKVYQVDDSPRYEGTATWTHVDGKSFWENITNAPLPRREYTKRDDYNVTIRGNRHEITRNGWIHDQDNDKIIRRKGNGDVLLAQEKGYNTYKKVANEKCKAAQDWWVINQNKWALVRDKWAQIFAKKTNLELKHEVSEKRLYQYLFDKKTNNEQKIEEIIDSFVTSK